MKKTRRPGCLMNCCKGAASLAKEKFLMYNILELSAKTLDQLKAIATEMGIQKIEGTGQEDLVYKILDQQAIDMASKAAANPPAPKGSQAILPRHSPSTSTFLPSGKTQQIALTNFAVRFSSGTSRNSKRSFSILWLSVACSPAYLAE